MSRKINSDHFRVPVGLIQNANDTTVVVWERDVDLFVKDKNFRVQKHGFLKPL